MMGLIVSLAVLLTLTTVVAWSVRGKIITAPLVVISIALAGAVGVTGFWLDNYTTCHSRQEGRADVKAAFNGLYDTFETLAVDDESKALVARLRAELDEQLPDVHCDGGLW